jgi:Protein of unknown function (DUF732)
MTVDRVRPIPATRFAFAVVGAATLGVVCGTGTALGPAARADQGAYIVNVTVRPGYNFPNSAAALDYGYGLCDRMRAGQRYPDLMTAVKSDFGTDDEFQASNLISQSAQELCPAMILQLRKSAEEYRPPPRA